MFAEAEEYNKPKNPAWARWSTCSLCEQQYHGFVYCALGWACWKTYLGRPEGDRNRVDAMNQLGNGLCEANCHEDALSVREAELAMLRRTGASEARILVAQNNLANSYHKLGRLEQALRMQSDVHSGRLRLHGEEDDLTLSAANNYAHTLINVKRSKEAETLLRRTVPVARRVLGENNEITLRARWIYATALCDIGATLDDLREAVTTLKSVAPSWKRVFGEAHPETQRVQGALKEVREALRAREESDVCDAMAAMTPGDA